MNPNEPYSATAIQDMVTVSIVSHGQSALVRKLLLNLDDVAKGSIARVVLTVNIPDADILADLNLNLPVKVIANTQAKGFGANHNAAFLHCETAWFLVLNPDIELSTDPLVHLMRNASAADGMLAPRIREPGKPGAEPHRKLLTPIEIFLKRMRPDRAALEPAWVPGMFMLFRSAAFAELHGFDKKYFMYVEDADLCARLQLSGWKMKVVEDVTVIHDARRASNRQWRALFWHMASLAKWWLSGAFWRTLLGFKR